MHNKLMLNIALCGLLTATNTTMTMDLSTTNTPKTSPINSPRVPHTNPLSSQSGRLSNSSHNAIEREVCGIPLQDPDLEGDYMIKRSQSYGELGYKITYCNKNKNDEEKTVICTVSPENKKDMNNATHIKIQEYDQDNKPIERILKRKEKIKITGFFTDTLKKNSQIYTYVSSREIEDMNCDEITYEDNQGNHTTANYFSTNKYSDEAFFVFNRCINDTWTTYAIKLPKPEKEQPNESQETADSMTTSSEEEEEKEEPIQKRIEPTPQIADDIEQRLAEIMAISDKKKENKSSCNDSDTNNPNTLYSLKGQFTDQDPNIVGKVLQFYHIRTMRKLAEKDNSYLISFYDKNKVVQILILIADQNFNENSVYFIDQLDTTAFLLPNNLDQVNQQTSIALSKNFEMRWQQALPTKTSPTEMTPRTVKNFQKLNSYAKAIKITLGLSAFAAFIIGILYQYDQLPQAFTNALNKIRILHAE